MVQEKTTSDLAMHVKQLFSSTEDLKDFMYNNSAIETQTATVRSILESLSLQESSHRAANDAFSTFMRQNVADISVKLCHYNTILQDLLEQVRILSRQSTKPASTTYAMNVELRPLISQPCGSSELGVVNQITSAVQEMQKGGLSILALVRAIRQYIYAVVYTTL